MYETVIENKHRHANWFKNRENILSYILDKTKFLDSIFVYVPLKLRIYHIVSNSDHVPKCQFCQNYTTFNKSKIDLNNPYNRFCSLKCRSKNQEIYTDKNWLYTQHIKLKKSAERIAEENNTSSVPVISALKRFNISHIDYRKSNSSTQSKLEDKEYLTKLYCCDNLTCEDIAKEIKSSRSTVSIWLNKHGIEINEPNSYPRKIQKTSCREREILNYIRGVYSGEIVENDRSILNGKEIDIFIPGKNLAIEYNGIYYHSINGVNKLPNNYHRDKTDICNKKGIQLLQIWEYYDMSIVKSIILNKLGLSLKVYARKCFVKTIDKRISEDFLNENHIQGSNKNDKVCLGLYYHDDLLSVMTFCKPRFNKRVDWELSRYATKKGYQIIGGASKLFKGFKESGDIITYADLSYSNGRIYETLGFGFVCKNNPSTIYVKNNEVFSRYRTQKKYLKNILEYYDPDISEEKNMINNGFLVLKNSGTLTYIKKGTQ